MAKKKEDESGLCVYLDASKRWRITSDPKNFILSRKVTPKNGKKPYYIVEGYYQNMKNLLESLASKRLLESEAKSVRQLTKEIKALHEELLGYAKVIIK